MIFYDPGMHVHIACISNLGFSETEWQCAPFKELRHCQISYWKFSYSSI